MDCVYVWMLFIDCALLSLILWFWVGIFNLWVGSFLFDLFPGLIIDFDCVLVLGWGFAVFLVLRVIVCCCLRCFVTGWLVILVLVVFLVMVLILGFSLIDFCFYVLRFAFVFDFVDVIVTSWDLVFMLCYCVVVPDVFCVFWTIGWLWCLLGFGFYVCCDLFGLWLGYALVLLWLFWWFYWFTLLVLFVCWFVCRWVCCLWLVTCVLMVYV